MFILKIVNRITLILRSIIFFPILPLKLLKDKLLKKSDYLSGFNNAITLKFSAVLQSEFNYYINPLNPELNPICYLLALLGAHNFLHFSRIRVKSLTFRRLM